MGGIMAARRSPDIDWAVRRYISTLAFLTALVVVLGAAGCGQRFERDAGVAPSGADLAADALLALEDVGSAHFVADVKSSPLEDAFPSDLSLHVEGDASSDALDAEGSVSFGLATLSGRILVGPHDLFIRFLDEWYADPHGLADVVEEARKEYHGQAWNELATPGGLRRNFDLLFEGQVSQGPSVDGAATWQFEGRLDADGVIELAKRFDAPPSAAEAELLRKVAEASKVVLLVGQGDRLPRRLELSVQLSPEDLNELQSTDFSSVSGAENFRASLELSEFGKQVTLDPSKNAKPLHELFDQPSRASNSRRPPRGFLQN
jgi:hypothetical protein